MQREYKKLELNIEQIKELRSKGEVKLKVTCGHNDLDISSDTIIGTLHLNDEVFKGIPIGKYR